MCPRVLRTRRRRRIFLVADFGSRSAGEMLFKPESRAGDIAEGGNARDSIAGNVENGIKQYTVDIGYSSDRIQLNPKTAVTLKSSGGGGGAKTGLYYLPVTVPSACDGIGTDKHKDAGKAMLSRGGIAARESIAAKYAIRRLTPTECERIQGYPDGWKAYGHDGKRISDNQRYRALGNSVAVPCVEFVLSGMGK